MDWKNKKYSFFISITSLLISTIVILAFLFLYISHRESRSAAIHTADRLFTEINTKTLQRYESALESVSLVAGLAAPMPGFDVPPVDGGMQHISLNYMFKALDQHDYIYSTYIGYNDGSFIQVIALRDNQELFDVFNAPPETVYILRIIAPDGSGVHNQSWYYLNSRHQATVKRNDLDPGYDPRLRVWYQQALQEETTFYTEPYVFSSYKIPGMTCAKKLVGGKGVFGVDITLQRFALSLVKQQISENGLLFLFDRSGRIIASPAEDPVQVDENEFLHFLTGAQSSLPTVKTVVADYMQQGDTILDLTREIKIDGRSYLAMLTGVSGNLKFNQILASVAPTADFTKHIRRMQKRILLLCSAVLAIILPLTLFISKMISGSLTQLELEARKIRQRDFSESAPFDSNITEIHSLIKAFSLMKSTIRHLLEQQRKLFDDFTKLIAGAIDAKSPYTGGHCARVPVVAEMLAKAACETKEGPFSTFDMNTADERWEFEVAAWLHDCGKVTTPEYVVDKATKLETIYNRIHEIRMRFEVLLRDAEITYYRGLLNGEKTYEALRDEFEAQKEQIIEDYAFVAGCNIGGEFMADDKINRLQRIASQTWQRNLDDRIGISEDESALKEAEPPLVLPVEEQILSDKPSHIIPRNIGENSLEDFEKFNMEVPEYQYNLGELYNLSIRKGTLTKEDRFKIQEHIIQTISMLSRLDFPDYLAKVPEYAGAHHETMIGTGYPCGLKKEEMSVPARIMAIADIFEALTAADRPYKKPKKLSESLKIMSFMCREDHIDPDLFSLFLHSGVYQEYAEKYIDRELIDKIDIDEYLPQKV